MVMSLKIIPTNFGAQGTPHGGANLLGAKLTSLKTRSPKILAVTMGIHRVPIVNLTTTMLIVAVTMRTLCKIQKIPTAIRIFNFRRRYLEDG